MSVSWSEDVWHACGCPSAGRNEKNSTHRTGNDPSDQLVIISLHDSCMNHDSLSLVPSFARYSARRRARGVAQKVRLEFSGPRSRVVCYLGPTGSDKCSFRDLDGS